MIQKIKDIFTYMNERGIPVPQARDHGRPSVSLTLLILSSIMVVLGIINFTIPRLNWDVNGWLALAWFVTNAVIYNNRGARISKDGIEISSNNNSQENKRLT